MNEEVPGGFKTTKTKKQEKNKRSGEGHCDSDAMDIDSLFGD
jgi:hypothetical protein